jgi:outer membrane biosynthesis protein TonB
VAVLRSEADFSDRELSRERRWLALFLLVHLVDEQGRLGTAYRRVLRRAGRTPGHWAHGRSLGAVRADVSRWIGVHARPDSTPPWDRIADLIHDAVHPKRALEVLATARYLHCLAAGEPNDAVLHRPHWLDPDVDNITTAMIGGPDWARKHGLADSAAPTPGPLQPESQQPEPPQPEPRQPEPQQPEPQQPESQPSGPEPSGAQPSESEPSGSERSESDTPTPRPPAKNGAKDPEWSAYQLLWTVVRAHREAQARIVELEHRVADLQEENAQLSGDVTTWLGGYRPTIPGQDRRTRPRRPVVADRHLALKDPAEAFTYPLPAELPAPRDIPG